LLKDAQSAKTAALDTETKRNAGEVKKRDDSARLMAAGRNALAAKKYDEAINSFTEALKLLPGDKDATRGLADARQALEAEKKQKTATDYDNALRAGRAALAAKKYDDAIKAFTEAGKILPGDRDAAALLKDAQNAKDAEAKKNDDFTKLMAAARNAMGAKKYDDAIKAYTDALKVMPGDKDAAKGLNDARQAADAAKAPKPDPKAEYAKQMQAGAAAEKQGKLADARAAYREALKWAPNDAKAAAALKNADFGAHMAEGKKLHDAKKYADAVKEYEAALKLFPDNKDAKDALKRAKDGKP
jgi:tetratricopeptide (TPR) repeat protein